MTMTDEEKAEARATDPRAAAIIDHCDAMIPDAMARLHGTLRDPHADPPRSRDGVDWWDPVADAPSTRRPTRSLVDGVRIAQGQPGAAAARAGAPTRRTCSSPAGPPGSPRCTCDVDGQRHVAVVLEDDPAADLHDWYGRYLYFAPDEVEPIGAQTIEG